MKNTNHIKTKYKIYSSNFNTSLCNKFELVLMAADKAKKINTFSRTKNNSLIIEKESVLALKEIYSQIKTV